MNDQASGIAPDVLLNQTRKRRVVRTFTDDLFPDDILLRITEAGRWATSGGNGYHNRFVIVRDPARDRLVRSAAPGMIPVPPALIVIALDTESAHQPSMEIEIETSHWVDVDTAAMNMMSVAQAFGVGTCPVTSFSKSEVATIPELPPHFSPEFILILGYPAPSIRRRDPNAAKPVTARDITFWEHAGSHDPD